MRDVGASQSGLLTRSWRLGRADMWVALVFWLKLFRPHPCDSRCSSCSSQGQGGPSTARWIAEQVGNSMPLHQTPTTLAMVAAHFNGCSRKAHGLERPSRVSAHSCAPSLKWQSRQSRGGLPDHCRRHHGFDGNRGSVWLRLWLRACMDSTPP